MTTMVEGGLADIQVDCTGVCSQMFEDNVGNMQGFGGLNAGGWGWGVGVGWAQAAAWIERFR